MWTKRVLHLVVAALVAQSTFGGAISAQDAPGSPCVGSRAAQGINHFTVEYGGLTREYYLYIPESYVVGQPITQPVPLVMSLHGFAGNPREQERDSGWDAIAERENFLVVYPAGTGSPLRWNAGQHEIPGLRQRSGNLLEQFLSGFFETVPADDVSFIRALIDELQAFYCIDPMRIYVNGMSNGGGMTNRLACQAADVFAAAGMVAGAYTDFGGCDPARPIPVIAFHGVKDPIVPYDGDREIVFPAIETWVADWAARDQCAASPETIAGTVGAVTGTRYTGCAGDAEVDFYSIADGGHTWPGGNMGRLPLAALMIGKTSHDINASETMWTFFVAHPMSY